MQLCTDTAADAAMLIDALSQDWQGRSLFMFPPFPLLSKVIQKLRTTQEGEVILIAYLPGGHHNHGFHIYYVFVWTTLSSFRTDRAYCHNRDMSWMASGTICMLGGSHATLPNSRIFKEVSRLVAALEDPQYTECTTAGGFASLTGPQDKEFISFSHSCSNSNFSILSL